MRGRLVVLTGASASGKTTLARHLETLHKDDCHFAFFDSIGVPSTAEMLAWYGSGHQPGGAWQRAMTLEWMGRIASIVGAGGSVLFEGQMRIAFLLEALRTHGMSDARVILVDCDDATRTARLHGERAQPELADEKMMGWARYLREEAEAAGIEVLDSGKMPFAEAVRWVEMRLSGE